MSPRTQARPRRWVWLALAAGIVVVLTALAGSQVRSRPQAPSPRAVRPPATPGPVNASAIPAVDLSQLTWTDFYGIRLPVSAQAGPRDQRDGLAKGFADTPEGAVLAAVHIGVRANAQWGPKIFVPTIRTQVTGPDVGALLANCHDSYEHGRQDTGVADGQPLGRVFVTEAGFRWAAFTPYEATIDLLSAGPGQDAGSSVQAATRIQLQWRSGDWRLVAPPGGDWGSSATQVIAPTGFTMFSTQG